MKALSPSGLIHDYECIFCLNNYQHYWCWYTNVGMHILESSSEFATNHTDLFAESHI